MHRAHRVGCFIAAALAMAAPLTGSAEHRRCGIRPDQVLIVVNENSAISKAIGEYYRAARGIPASNVVAIQSPLRAPDHSDRRDETTNNANYARRIRDPVAKFLTEKNLRDKIRVIVTTKGVPLRDLRRPRRHEPHGPARPPPRLGGRGARPALLGPRRQQGRGGHEQSLLRRHGFVRRLPRRESRRRRCATWWPGSRATRPTWIPRPVFRST